MPPRILLFRLRLDRFDYQVAYVPGKNLHTADALSRSPEESVEIEAHDEVILREVNMYLPAGEKQLELYKREQHSDPVCSQVINYCCNGWPSKSKVTNSLKPYWEIQGEFTLCNSLLLRGRRIVVPKSLQKNTVNKIHNGHMGIQKCRARARNSVWWPEMSQQISDFIKRCQICAKETRPTVQPMIASQLPDYPWQRVGSDLFQLRGSNYLLVVDYFSRYPEVIKLKGTTSREVIEALKAIFSRHGIPEVVVSDNGPQYTSQEFYKFSSQYNFCHLTSSPLYPQSNGQAERGVQTVKGLITKAEDPYMALLSYRATPLSWSSLSPAELSMGRRLRCSLPQAQGNYCPEWPYLKAFQQQNQAYKQKQVIDFNSRHRARTATPIPSDSDVWVTSGDQPIPGRVIGPAHTPRSYMVETSTGSTVRRNQHHLNVVPPTNGSSSTSETEPLSPPHRIMTRTQTGTVIRPPDRYH